MSEYIPNDNHRQQISARLNPNANYELQFWAKKYNITQDMLKYAVNKVGTSTADIENYLRSQYLIR